MNNLIDTKIFSKDELQDAAKLIRAGEVVAFPTETVYGLGADAMNFDAVSKIFKAKNRPQDNPLIVHVSNISQVEALCTVTDIARVLIKEFWPGPLALILNKKNGIPKNVTAGLDTVAVRMPNHSVALDFIRFANTPIAAPSANISGRPSGTTFEHVFKDLNGKVAGIIKFDESLIGLESSVVDLTVNPPVLLRPGGVDFEDLKKFLSTLKIQSDHSGAVKSPGMKYKHYSPRAKIILFEESGIDKLAEFKENLKSEGFSFEHLLLENTLDCSHNLFRFFRECDDRRVDYILISSISEAGIGLAIMNRVRKAAFEIVK